METVTEKRITLNSGEENMVYKLGGKKFRATFAQLRGETDIARYKKDEIIGMQDAMDILLTAEVIEEIENRSDAEKVKMLKGRKFDGITFNEAIKRWEMIDADGVKRSAR